MPTPPNYYPNGWLTFSNKIRFLRAHRRCECTGQCGLHQSPLKNRRCTEIHGEAATFARGKIVLTTAHLCTCAPICMIESHVIAACQRCHLRIDRYKHAAARLQTQARKKAQQQDHTRQWHPRQGY